MLAEQHKGKPFWQHLPPNLIFLHFTKQTNASTESTTCSLNVIMFTEANKLKQESLPTRIHVLYGAAYLIQVIKDASYF